MWFLTHIRHSQARNTGLTTALLTACWLLTGCASAPKLTDADGRFASLVPPKIPVPVFDEAEPPSRVASMGPIVLAPKPFEWTKLAVSAGKRDIEGITIGQGGYRTVVVGSLAGDDPLAIAVTEKLAEHVHQNQIILGGIQTTVIRNPNPDGAARFRTENENGVSLNRQFISGKEAAAKLQQPEPEIRFLSGLLSESQPQRVIHIRSIGREHGVVAASSGAASVANDVSSWLEFDFVALPGTSLEGTLERFLSNGNSCEIITFAIPQSTEKSALWDLYGDSLLNLLLDEDFEARKLARQQRGTTAADSRGKKDQPSPREDD